MYPGSRQLSIILAIALISVSANAGGQSRPQPTKRVAGTVQDASGAVISGADVSLKDFQGNSCGSAKTNNSGRFSLPSCGNQLVLKVTSEGFQAFQKEV